MRTCLFHLELNAYRILPAVALLDRALLRREDLAHCGGASGTGPRAERRSALREAFGCDDPPRSSTLAPFFKDSRTKTEG